MEDLSSIDKLVADNKGWSSRLPPARAVSLILLVGSLAISILMSFTWGGFRDSAFLELFENRRFASELVIFAFTVVFAGYLALGFSVPGHFNSSSRNWAQVLGLVVLFSSIALLLYSQVSPSIPVSMNGKRHHCFLEALSYGAIMLGVFHWCLSRRCSFHPKSSGAYAGLAASVLPGALMHVGCMYEPWHILKFHFSQVLILVPLSVLISSIVFHKKNL